MKNVKKPKKIEVVIDRSKWRTGAEGKYATGRGDTVLLNFEGSMCCLGFISSCYLKSKRKNSTAPIMDVGGPCEIGVFIPELNQKEDVFNNFEDTKLTSKAIVINDDEFTKPETKEKKLKELFKSSMYKLKFVGEFDTSLRDSDCD